MNVWQTLEQQGLLNGQVDGIDPETGFRMVGQYAAGRRVGEWKLVNQKTGEELRVQYAKEPTKLGRAAKMVTSPARFATLTLIDLTLDWLRAGLRLHPVIFATALLVGGAMVGDAVIRKVNQHFAGTLQTVAPKKKGLESKRNLTEADQSVTKAE